MKDSTKTKSELLDEIDALKQRIQNLEQSDRQQKRLQTSRWTDDRRFITLAETTSDWIWEIDSDNVYTYASSKVKDLLGYEPAEIIGKTPFNLMPADEGKRVSALFKEIAESRRSFSGLENINLHKDGHQIFIETNGAPFFDHEGNYLGYCGFERDITARKQMEETLRASEELYSRLVDTIPDMIIRTDMEGKILFINDVALQISAYRRDEILGHNMLTFVDPEDHDRLLQNAVLMMQNRLGPREYQFMIKNGTRIPFEANGDVLRNQEGVPFGLVFVCRDIRERKRAAEERYRNEKLHGVLEMAGTVCHELNQPMQIISGYAEMILKNSSEDDLIHIKIDKIHKQIHRMGAITKKLMTINDYETRDYAGFSRIIDIKSGSDQDGP